MRGQELPILSGIRPSCRSGSSEGRNVGAEPPDSPAPTSASMSSITRKQSAKIMALGREDGGQ